MAREAGGSTHTLFLNVSSSTGFLYRKPTAEEEAHYRGLSDQEKKKSPIREVERKDKSKILHYNYYSTDFGIIDSITEDEIKHDSGVFKILKIRLKTDSGFEEISINSRTQKGGLSQIFKSIITILPNLDKNTKYRISTSKKTYTKTDGKEGHNVNVFFNYSTPGKVNSFDLEEDFVRNKLTWINKSNPNGDIPQAELEDNMGTQEWSFKKQDSYLYAEFKKYSEILNSTPIAESKAPEPKTAEPKVVKSKVVEPIVSNSGDDELDDLPF